MDKIVFSHNVSGIDELTALLTALGNVDEAKMALENGLRIAASRIKATAKDLCPTDTHQLQNSIEVEDLPDDGSVVGVKIAPHTEYAVHVEFGTGIRGEQSDIASKSEVNLNYTLEKKHKCKNKKINGTTYPYMGMSPRPYMYPALKAHEKEIPGYVKSALQVAINKYRG